MESGMYVGIRTNGRSWATYIPEEEMSFSKFNREVDSRNAKREAQQAQAQAAADEARKRQQKEAARAQKRKAKLVMMALRMFAVCAVMFLSQLLGFVNEWFAVAVMVSCLAIFCCRIGEFMGQNKSRKEKRYGN